MNTETVKDYWSKSVTDCVKGYMCICVLIHHLYQHSGFFSHTYFGHFLQMLGYWAVGVFLFVSGYGLMFSFKNKEGYLKTFFSRRSFPLYFSYAVLVIIYFAVFPENISLEFVLRSFLWGGTVVYTGWFFQMILPLYLIFYLSFRFVKKTLTGFVLFLLFCGAYAFACTRCGQRHMEILLFVFGMFMALIKDKFDVFLKRFLWLLIAGVFAVFFSVYMIYVRSVVMGKFSMSDNLLNLLIIISDMAVAVFVVCVCYFSTKKGIPLIENPFSRWISKYSLEIYGLQTMVILVLLPVMGRTVPFILVSIVVTVLLAVALKTLTSYLIRLINGKFLKG